MITPRPSMSLFWQIALVGVLFFVFFVVPALDFPRSSATTQGGVSVFDDGWEWGWAQDPRTGRCYTVMHKTQIAYSFIRPKFVAMAEVPCGEMK